MITRQIFEQMLEAEKFYEQNLKTLERENAVLWTYIRELERGSPKTTPKANRASDQTDNRFALDHSAEFNTRKVYE
jgi:hypothetical protein